ncbi:hypothetical protein L1049_019432 [Liquidambar formosana]|uniref:DUF4220 domain-containing protein n=1 Tax=Liquidambar formosana TaxID=63359 RepID=A0AAP0SCK9_LIQFO
MNTMRATRMSHLSTEGAHYSSLWNIRNVNWSLALSLNEVQGGSIVYRLNLLAIPVFIAGIIKYGERTWVLRSASTEYLKYSLLPTPDPKPEYTPETIDKDITAEAKFKHEAYFLFKIYRRLYADLPIDFTDLEKSVHILPSDLDIFKVIELELGFLYDELYTKTSFVCSVVGICLRSISSISSIVAFVGFLIIDKHGYSSVNVIISYVLLVGAIILDIYAAILLLFSDWTMVWLTDLNRRSPLPNRIFKDIFSSQLAITGSKRWSHSMRQYNLIDNCLRHDQSTKCLSFFRELKIYETLENCQQIDSDDVLNYFQKCFSAHYFEKLDSSMMRIANSSASDKEKLVEFNKICNDRGEYTLKKFGASGVLGSSIVGDFDESIILWHIATDLCYHHDTKNKLIEDPDKIPVACRNSKWLSDYMLYLLVMRPFMLPMGIGQIRYEETAAEAKRFFLHSGLISGRTEAIEKLLGEQDSHARVFCRIESFEEEFPTSRSVLEEGFRLARELLLLNMKKEEWMDKSKWDMIFLIWLDLLCYAASQCRWNQHARQLARGGELLTHVSLFMAHRALTDLFKETSFDRRGGAVLSHYMGL